MFVAIFCVVLSATFCQSLPNFVFVLTDDQDLILRSLDYMNKTTTYVANEGLTFTNFFVNTPVCCPSRSSILTGKYIHNCHVFNNSLNGGCSGPEWQQIHEKYTIASTLKNEKNYQTFYAGKYLNMYGENNTGGVEHIPQGYDWWLGLKGNSVYYNYSLSINGSGKFFQDDYLTDKITEYALDFLNIQNGGNFFMMLAPPAAHAPFTPAPRHMNLYSDLKALRNVAFNATPINKHWLVGMPPAGLPEDVSYLDEIYRNRILTLQAVDDMVEAVILKLEEMEVLDNTYVIFSSDNGFHIGQFTQPWDKRQPYESDIHLPLIIRGPNISKKVVSEFPVAGIDLFPTILDLAEISLNETDGQSVKDYLFSQNSTSYNRNILLEYRGEADFKTVHPDCPWTEEDNLAQCVPESWCKCQDARNNTYECVLNLSNDSKFKFCVFEGGFFETYDLINDPYELDNLEVEKRKVDEFLEILGKLKGCKGKICKI